MNLKRFIFLLFLSFFAIHFKKFRACAEGLVVGIGIEGKRFHGIASP
jgi:hypothetical protein